MVRTFAYGVASAILFAIFSLPLLAQTASVKGTCRDAQGSPLIDAQVVWQNQENGRSYKLKTNKKGEFFSLGIDPGNYTITISKDGKELDKQKNYHVGLDEVTYPCDMKQASEETAKQQAKQQGVSTEEVKKQQEANAKAEQYNASVKAVNEKINAAVALMHSPTPDYDKAIALLTDAAQMAPNEDVVWGDLGGAYLNSVGGQTDPAEKTKRNTAAHDDFQKAIDLKKASMQAQPAGAQGTKPPQPASQDANSRLAGYYANFASAAARLGKADEAIDAYKQAIELNPANAANYYFNLGIVLHNSAKDTEGKKQAADAFDKAIAADPTKAEAYYLKGTDLFGTASQDSSGKLVAPDGTAEALQKYLELQPNGPHADDVKQMLAMLNQTIESSYGTKKTPPKKK